MVFYFFQHFAVMRPIISIKKHELFYRGRESFLRTGKLERTLVRISLFNLLIVSLLGVLMRSIPLIDNFPLLYKNVLHGHSHFAFGGWLMPILLVQIIRAFPQVKESIGLEHLKMIAFALLFSAAGMLVTFPFMGYALASIIFSTLSVAASFYLVVMVWKALKGRQLSVSEKFLKAGLVWLALSAIGPFATGPIIAMGQQGSPLYFNSVYFYLHFQVNGWFVFVILALLYRLMENKGVAANGDISFKLMNLAVVPTFFLSVLWNQPSAVFYVIGGAGAVLQLAALFYMVKDWQRWKNVSRISTWIQVALVAFVMKLVLQFLGAFPLFASMAFENKSIVIAFLHLVLLGFVSLFVLDSISEHSRLGEFRNGMKLFLGAFVFTELLMVLYAMGSVLGFLIPYYQELLLAFSLFFPLGIWMMLASFYTRSTAQPFRLVSISSVQIYSIATRLH